MLRLLLNFILFLANDKLMELSIFCKVWTNDLRWGWFVFFLD